MVSDRHAKLFREILIYVVYFEIYQKKLDGLMDEQKIAMCIDMCDKTSRVKY